MEMKYFVRSVCLLFFASISITFWFYTSRIPLPTEKTWVYLRLMTSPCLSSEGCLDFNVTCYFHGKIIFYGINNTAFIGKKIFQLERNQTMVVREFIQKHLFKSDLEQRNIFFYLEFSQNNREIYFWRNDSISYTILTSILTIDTLTSYKRWSVLLRTAYMLSNIRQRKQIEPAGTINSKQKFKRSIKARHSMISTSSEPLIIPITLDLYMLDDYKEIPVPYFAPIGQSISTIGLVSTDYDHDLCFSSQVTKSTFDLIDACLSTNDMIGDNQFYPLREQLTWIFDQDELIIFQGKSNFYFKIGS